MSSLSPDITDKPHPDADPDAGKPDSPTSLKRGTWKLGLKRAAVEFSKDNCTDLAASLTYFAVLSLFPALLAVVSLLGVFGQGQATVDAVMDILDGSVPEETLAALRGPIEGLINTPAAGFALVTGVVGALWTASGYVGGFGRAMNRIYEVEEGRPFWKLKPMMVLLTAVLLLLVALAGLMLVVSGPIAQWVGDLIGLGSTAVTVWGIAKWPVLVLVVVIILAVLYGFAPNVKQPKFRWISLGAVVALIVWGVATVGFFFYVSNFSSYNATYGSLAGVIVFLLWLWITNNAFLFGAEVDAEMERARQLQAGMHAEENIQLPPRDTTASDKAAEKRQQAIDDAADVRREAQVEQARDRT
ncbi:YihY/virulence factor BrkB family protein [Dietzia sp. ANT_WB102]|uniref:YihY/virulence factor BrkB family protein n=1 Tax=Dietzia sp. ANT_WB102 TaxID=2597345 RepID=UPI0011EC4A9B|nr:YihY/virulence factor BrkB family protein [Dietzia sp. ANT_WB102]KAA0918996.1 YihY/virulence factor BrkB family protein [Dietzia sp. ANT_WB102]